MATIGGTNLGTATGKIRIDTADIEKTTVTVKRVSRELKKSLDDAGRAGGTLGTRIGAGLKTAGNQITSISQKIGGLRNEILGISAVGAGITFVGIKAASNIQAAQIQLKGLTGSTEEAAQLMELLREQAAKAGVPFGDILSASKSLLPTLEGNTAELERLLPLVQRVAVLNQGEGLAGAAFSINEALSSGGTDLVSLSERFNISRTLLRNALEQTGGDFAAALDIVLNKMGITAQTADEMGASFNASFRVAKDAASQFLGAGLQPILEFLTPILQKSAEWLNQLRQTAPAVATLGSGIAGIVAVGGPALIFISSMVSAADNLKNALLALKTSGALSALGAAALPLAVGGAALAAGAVAGNALGRGIGRATGNEDVANTTLKDIPRILRQAAIVVADGMSKINIIIASGVTAAMKTFATGIAGMVGAMGKYVSAIAKVLPENFGGEQLGELGQNIQGLGTALAESADTVRNDFLQGLVDSRKEFMRGTLDFFGFETGSSAAAGGGVGAVGGETAVDTGFNEQQKEAITQFYADMAAIEKNGSEQRLQIEQQYQQNRQTTITQYNRASLREEQDFARSRRRQNEQYSRDVQKITEDRVERELDWLENLNESIANITSETNDRIAEMRQDGNERIAEIEDDYNRRREQSEREHRDTLLSAASRLDAGAIAAEQRRYATQTATAETEFKKRIADERDGLQKRIEQEQENLQERIAQEREAHAQRIAEAREADAERIADMREALVLQQRMEDEDRAIRLRRTEEDHRRQLAEMEKANQAQLAEIAKQTALEKAELTKRFQAQLADMGVASTAYLKAQEEKQEKSLESFEKYWSDWEKIIEDKEPSTGGKSYASGGVVDYTGSAQVHGSRSKPEFMLNADTTSQLKAMLGNFSQSSILSAVSGAGNGGMNIGGINMPIYAAAGQSPTDIAVAVERQLINLFRSMS